MTDSNPKPTPSRIIPRQQGSFNQTFQSSILQKQQKFSFDKTLVQGIKQNDSSKIIQNSEESTGQETQLYDQQKEIHQMFVSTRKKFDQSKQISVKLEQNIQRFKKEKEMLLAEKSKIEQTFSAQQKEFTKIQEQLQKLTATCDTADYQKSIRQQISQTLRQDILFYKKHCFDHNTKILRNHNKLKSLTSQFQSTKKVTTNCRALVYSIQKKITDNQSKRFTKLHSFHQVINKKMQNTFKRQQRQKMIEESMLQALYGKMPEEQQQKKLLLGNIVLKKMLKSKMEREMQKFSEIEGSFRQIQQNTTVKRVDQFVDKFIRREKIYGQLLESISKNQDKINALKQQHQLLQKQNHDVTYMKQMIQEKENEKRSQFKKEVNVSIDLVRERLLRNQFLKNKVIGFVSKFLAGFDGGVLTEVKEKLDRQRPHDSLKAVLQRVNSLLDNINNGQQDSQQKLKEIYIQSKNLTLPTSLKTRNMRIKTVAVGEQNQNSVMEDYDVAYDDLSQREFLNQNRKQIKKSAYLRNRMKTRAN